LQILGAMQNNTQLAEAATVPTAAASPLIKRNALLGVVLGLVLGFALAFLTDRLDRRLREPEDIEQAFGLPMLGLIPHSPLGAGPAGGGANVDLEPFRMLRAHLRYFNVDRELRVLLVTSSRPGEGKTTIARGLAVAAASMGTRSLLIEADLRKPALTREFKLESSLGLSGSLVDHAKPFGASVQHVNLDSSTNGDADGRVLDVLPAGVTPPNAAELLESHMMETLLAWARERYELVVIDTAPLSVVADAIPLMTRVDGVLVVSRLGLSTQDGSEHLRERLDSLGAPMLGVVINDMRTRSGGYYGYDYRDAPQADSDVEVPPAVPARPTIDAGPGENGDAPATAAASEPANPAAAAPAATVAVATSSRPAAAPTREVVSAPNPNGAAANQQSDSRSGTKPEAGAVEGLVQRFSGAITDRRSASGSAASMIQRIAARRRRAARTRKS
jgi:capsular exopolysaccharide synthesis family protein